MKYLLNISFIIFVSLLIVSGQEYEPTWESLNSRPLPAWYDEVKFGIFIHWGVFSVPAYGPDHSYAEWYWYYLKNPSSDNNATLNYHNQHFGSDYPYEKFASQFNARLFNPDDWASLIYSSGARYVVLTSKHHEGFTLWPSEESWNWNSVDTGPQLDLVGSLTKSIKATKGMHMGLYHSLYEWFNPIYLKDKSNNPPTQNYVNDVLQKQLRDIVNTYEPDLIWSDGDWEFPSNYWQSPEFLCWLYNNSTVKDSVVVNDRWGSECRMKNGGYWTGSDAYNPGYLIPHKWENCNTMGFSYGYDQFEALQFYQSGSLLIQEMVTTISCGGNYLLNIGPTAEGTIPVIMQERLEDIGQWMAVNSEAIYFSKPWRVQNDTAAKQVWYTYSPVTKAVYAISFSWPESGVIQLTQAKGNPSSQVVLLGYTGKSAVTLTSQSPQGITIHLPTAASPTDYPPQGVYTFRLTNVN